MSKYTIKADGIDANTEPNVAIAKISYEVENAEIHHLTQRDVKHQFDALINESHFPEYLNYISSFYDADSGLSGVAFQDTRTNRVTVGFAGTNLEGSDEDKKKDIMADVRIVTSTYSADDDYFKKGQSFLKQLRQEGYEVHTVTGHSKGGRDCMVLGMDNQIPNIVTYNAAPTTNLFGQVLASQIEHNLLPQMAEDTKLFYSQFQYKGKITNYVTSNDILNTVARIFFSCYPGETKEIDTGSNKPSVEGHDISQFITNKGGLNYGLAMLGSQKELLLSYGSGGLTSAQEVYLDARQALLIVQSFQMSVQSDIVNLIRQENEWIREAEEHWNNTLKEANKINQSMDPEGRLTQQEILEELASVGCTRESIVDEPKEKYETQKRKLQKALDNVQSLSKQLKKVIQEQVQSDQELAKLFGQ